jgi:hypothetical protein
MPQVFKSGAFIQQCFSVHPLCLSLHKFTPPELVVLTCSSCQMTHRIKVRMLTTRVPVALATEEITGSDERGWDHLGGCMVSHPRAVRVRDMDVVNDHVGLRCADCRRLYDLDAQAFETLER